MMTPRPPSSTLFPYTTLFRSMIGRGNATDLPKGGPGYLEVVGARRLSTEYGDLLEQVNRGERRPFTFNYEYDVPGRSEEHTSELQSHVNLVCRLLLEKKK